VRSSGRSRVAVALGQAEPGAPELEDAIDIAVKAVTRLGLSDLYRQMHGNARGIAAAQSVLANGGAYGKRLLSDAGRQQVLRNEIDGVDLVLGTPMRWGMGYALSAPTGMNFAPRSAYWAGNGGSLSYVDLDERMSVGFAMNRWVRGEHENDRSFRLMAAVYESLQGR
jgi:hypothetical protein